MEEKFDQALSKVTRNTAHVHELFIMASDRREREPIYLELTPGGFYHPVWDEVWDDDYLSGNIFVIVPRYSAKQLQFMKEHRDCSPEEIPGFTEMIGDLHSQLQRKIQEKRSQSESKPVPKTKRNTREHDDRAFLRAISGETRRVF